MTGLAHRGWSLNDYGRHLVHPLREAGYWSALIGEQHLSVDPAVLGYDHVVDIGTTRVHSIAPAALQLLRSRPPQPFFLSIGFFETHREFFEPELGARRAVRRAAGAPARHGRDARGHGVVQGQRAVAGPGRRRRAARLDELDLVDNTILVLTTDHGLAFPGAKATLTDRGLGVMLIVRGPGGFLGGHVTDALVSQVDIYPTLCELAGAPLPDGLAGRSLLPLAREEIAEMRDELFAELTYHVAYDPQRAIRTRRHKLIRHFGDRLEPVLPNVDDSPSKACWSSRAGASACARARSSTTCSWTRARCATSPATPVRRCAGGPRGAAARVDGRDRRPAPRRADRVPPGAWVNDPAGLSPDEPPHLLHEVD